MSASDMSPELRLMQGHAFRDHYQDLRTWLFNYVYEQDRALFDKDLKHVTDVIDLRFHEAPGQEDYVIWDHLKWYLHIENVWAEGGRERIESIVVFTAVLDIARGMEKNPKLVNLLAHVATREQLNFSDFNSGIVYTFGYNIRFDSSSLKRSHIRIFPGMLDFSVYKDSIKLHDFYNEDKRISPKWAALVCNAFPTVYNKEQQVAEQEGNGIQYYNRQQLDEVLKGTVAAEELPHVMKFIDDSVSNWSRHLILNTHKKQTQDTPRFSLHEGPGIVTILLDRSDLDWGERAPQLQMIFSDTPNGPAISPRISGGMTTSRMLDAFDQIVLELNKDQIVSFNAVDQVVTFVDQVSDHEESMAFREAIGDPKQALKAAGDEDPNIFFNMFRNGDRKVHVRTLGVSKNEGQESSLLGEIILDDIGEAGRIQLRVAEDSPKLPGIARNVSVYEHASKTGADEGGAAAQMAPVWEEVRSTKADPDSVMDKLPTKVEAKVEIDPTINPSEFLEFHLAGRDKHALKFFIDRLRNNGGLSKTDSVALNAFEQFVFGAGLANIREWSFIACVTDDRTEEEETLLFGDNNAYILIHNEETYHDDVKSSIIVAFQCCVAELTA